MFACQFVGSRVDLAPHLSTFCNREEIAKQYNTTTTPKVKIFHIAGYSSHLSHARRVRCVLESFESALVAAVCCLPLLAKTGSTSGRSPDYRFWLSRRVTKPQGIRQNSHVTHSGYSSDDKSGCYRRASLRSLYVGYLSVFPNTFVCTPQSNR